MAVSTPDLGNEPSEEIGFELGTSQVGERMTGVDIGPLERSVAVNRYGRDFGFSSGRSYETSLSSAISSLRRVGEEFQFKTRGDAIKEFSARGVYYTLYDTAVIEEYGFLEKYGFSYKKVYEENKKVLFDDIKLRAQEIGVKAVQRRRSILNGIIEKYSSSKPQVFQDLAESCAVMLVYRTGMPLPLVGEYANSVGEAEDHYLPLSDENNTKEILDGISRNEFEKKLPEYRDMEEDVSGLVPWEIKTDVNSDYRRRGIPRAPIVTQADYVDRNMWRAKWRSWTDDVDDRKTPFVSRFFLVQSLYPNMDINQHKKQTSLNHPITAILQFYRTPYEIADIIRDSNIKRRNDNLLLLIQEIVAALHEQILEELSDLDVEKPEDVDWVKYRPLLELSAAHHYNSGDDGLKLVCSYIFDTDYSITFLNALDAAIMIGSLISLIAVCLFPPSAPLTLTAFIGMQVFDKGLDIVSLSVSAYKLYESYDDLSDEELDTQFTLISDSVELVQGTKDPNSALFGLILDALGAIPLAGDVLKIGGIAVDTGRRTWRSGESIVDATRASYAMVRGAPTHRVIPTGAKHTRSVDDTPLASVPLDSKGLSSGANELDVTGVGADSVALVGRNAGTTPAPNVVGTGRVLSKSNQLDVTGTGADLSTVAVRNGDAPHPSSVVDGQRVAASQELSVNGLRNSNVSSYNGGHVDFVVSRPSFNLAEGLSRRSQLTSATDDLSVNGTNGSLTSGLTSNYPASWSNSDIIPGAVLYRRSREDALAAQDSLKDAFRHGEGNQLILIEGRTDLPFEILELQRRKARFWRQKTTRNLLYTIPNEVKSPTLVFDSLRSGTRSGFEYPNSLRPSFWRAHNNASRQMAALSRRYSSIQLKRFRGATVLSPTLARMHDCRILGIPLPKKLLQIGHKEDISKMSKRVREIEAFLRKRIGQEVNGNKITREFIQAYIKDIKDIVRRDPSNVAPEYGPLNMARGRILNSTPPPAILANPNLLRDYYRYAGKDRQYWIDHAKEAVEKIKRESRDKIAGNQ